MSDHNQTKDLEKELEKKNQLIANLEERLIKQKQEGVGGETARKYKDLQLALQQAEKDNRTKSEFLMSMGHEIRAPLNGIMGMTNLVLETDLSFDQRSHLEMVNSSAEQLLDVVTDVLDYCRIESGTMKLNHEDFNLSDSLDCDLYLMKISARQKNIDLDYKIGRDVPEELNSDPDRLVQVIMNLVSNAIKFTEKGAVTVNVENLGSDDNNMVVLKFSVTDTGVGIPLEKQSIITDTFNQTYSSYSRKFWGGGLGLIVSSRLVYLAGGEIGLESDPGKGATFWFTWKFSRPSELISEPIQTHKKSELEDCSKFVFDGARVLLAEDEPISRILIETLLEQAGMSVHVVENGRQAADKAFNGGYQVILMDVQMPVMDGLEATREIREHERRFGGHTPVIALTAHAMHGDRERCLQAGMDDYLTKPLSKNELFDVLTRYLTNTALIVDGESLSQQKVVEFLIEEGWRVTIAESGRSAMYEASLSHFDLILLDTEMVQVDGLETTRVIRRLEEYSGRHALILGISSSGDQEVEARYRESGVDDFLQRPFKIAELQKKLEQSGFES